MHETQVTIMKAIQEKPTITNSELQELTGLSNHSAVDYHIKNLIISGHIQRLNGFKILKRI